MRFTEFGLEPSLLSGIQKLKYDECTPIQDVCIPPVLEGRDVAGLAQTGTGKTAAFLIPLMDRILKSRINLESLPEDQRAGLAKRAFQDWKAQNFILILVPTRELAEQVQENVQLLSVDSGLKGFAIYGGTAYDRQKEAVKNGLEFVVATPGRLIDLYKEHIVDLKQVRAVVFDEADRMFDMGFKDDMKFILGRIPRERQFLVFSATLNFEVTNTAYQFGADPVEFNVSRDQAKAENVKDEIFHCGGTEKPQFLISLLKKYNPKQAIIFSNYKFSVEKIARFLSDNGIPAMGISSLLTQAQRNRVLEQFKAENEKNIMVATDVAARGLDIKGVDLVINYDLPQDAESYVHRIGRTGRAGAEGRAFSLVGDKDVESLERVQEYLKHKLDVGWMEETELLKEFKQMTSDERHYEDRGPRRDGPSGGRGGDRDSRGPRGPRPQRGGGPRAEGRSEGRGDGRRGEHSGGRPPRGGGRNDNRADSRPDNRPDLRKPPGERQQADRPPRPQGQGQQQGGRPRHQQHAGGNGAGGPHKSSGRPQHPRHKSPRPPHKSGTQPTPKSHPQKSIAQKVTGFLKRLVGG